MDCATGGCEGGKGPGRGSGRILLMLLLLLNKHYCLLLM